MSDEDSPTTLWSAIWRKAAGPYAPLIAIAVAIALIATLVPRGGKKAADASGTPDIGTEPTTVVTPGSSPGTSSTGVASLRPGSVSGTVGSALPSATASGLKVVGPGSPVKGGRCRPDGRMPIGTWPYAPTCVAPFAGDNGGATARGVTSKEIRVVVYQQKNDNSYLLTGNPTGPNSDADWDRTITAYEKWFNARYETYGRHVKFIRFKSNANKSDDQQVRADAIKVADEHKAFASLWGPASFAYCDELAARRVMCMPLSSPRRDMVQRLSPYVWSYYMNPEDSTDLRSEHICKKLGGGRKAIWAGDAAFTQRPRKFAIVHMDSPSGQYQRTGKYSQDLLAACGIRASLIYYTYDAGDVSTLATQAVGVAAKLAGESDTTVICACDPLFPIFLTQEADRQRYNPEWYANGVGYIDLDFVGRLYSQTQWRNAFGFSVLPVPTLANEVASYQAFKSVDPTGEPFVYAGWIFALMSNLMTGIQGAGPTLNAFSFRSALYRYPPSGGTQTHPLVRFASPGKHDALADAREIWWDPNARGVDGKTGAYRSVAAGARYTFGRWPSKDTPFFNPKGTVVYYERPPDASRV